MCTNLFKLSYSCLPPFKVFLKFLRFFVGIRTPIWFFVGIRTPICKYGFISKYFWTTNQTCFIILISMMVSTLGTASASMQVVFGCCYITFISMYFGFEFWILGSWRIILFHKHVPWISRELCMVLDWIMRWLFTHVCLISLLL